MTRSYGRRARGLALLLIDIQKDFVDRRSPVGSVGKALCVPVAATLLCCCRQAKIPVIHIITLHAPDGSTLMLRHRSNGVFYCIEGTEGAEVVPQVAPLPDEYIVVKRGISGFFKTNLESILKALGTKTLILTGLALDCCVQSTALDAAQRGYDVIIPYQAVSSSSTEKYKAGVTFVAETVGQVVELQDLISFLENPARGLREAGEEEAVRWFRSELERQRNLIIR